MVRSLLDREHDVVTCDLGGSDHRLRLALTDDELAALARVDGEAFVRASEVRGEGASVHNLDGRLATVQEIIAAIERAAPEAAGLITAGDEPLPFPASVDATSFTELVGGPVSRPLADGVAEAIATFRAT